MAISNKIKMLILWGDEFHKKKECSTTISGYDSCYGEIEIWDMSLWIIIWIYTNLFQELAKSYQNNQDGYDLPTKKYGEINDQNFQTFLYNFGNCINLISDL